MSQEVYVLGGIVLEVNVQGISVPRACVLWVSVHWFMSGVHVREGYVLEPTLKRYDYCCESK